MFSLSPIQLHQLRESKRTAAQALVTALKKPRDVLITILLGNELVNVSISIVSAALIARVFRQGPIAETAISVALVTPLVLVLGEIVPKNLALRFATYYSQIAILPLRVFSVVTYPVRVVLTKVADFFIRLFGGTGGEQPLVMEQEYRQLVDLGRREGVIIEEERELIHNIFEFSDKVVSSIMTPVDKVFSLPVDLPYEEILERIKNNLYSRIPFYQDTPDNIIGILHVMDLFAFDRKRRAGGEQEIKSLLLTPLSVTRDHRLEDLLREFQKSRMHFAIVQNPAGPVEGIVTMDDVLENLFGEMED